MKLIRLCLYRPAFANAIAFAALLAACGGKGSDGAAGTPGTPGEAGKTPEATPPVVTINQVIPRVGLVDRALQVLVTFDGAIDPSKATIDFGGDGVKVGKTTPQGNGVLVDVEIDSAAKLGKHDVTVKVGDKTVIAKQAFVVAVPLEAKLVGGKAEQGGLARIEVANRDRIAFDKKNFQLFPLAKDKDPTLIAFGNESFTETNGAVILLGDPLAKTGALGFLGVNDPRNPDSASYLTAPDAVSVTARSPEVLTAGTEVEKAFENDLETGFYSIDLAPRATEGLIVEASALIVPGSPVVPLLLAYPASGTVTELLDQGYDPGFPIFGIPPGDAHLAYPVTTATRGFFLVVDGNLGHGPTFKTSVGYTTARASIIKEAAAAHATPATAQSLSSLPNMDRPVPGVIATGELKVAAEVDVYKFISLSADKPTDLLVTVSSEAEVVVRVDSTPTFDSDNAIEVTLGGSAGKGTTAGLVGTTRYIEVRAASDANKPTGKYTLGMKRVPSPVL